MKEQLKTIKKSIFITFCVVVWSIPAMSQPPPCDCTGLTGADLTACIDACGGTNDVPLDDYLPILATAGAALGLYFFIRRKALS
jgi:hypothetical protein